MNNLKQIGLAHIIYAQDFDGRLVPPSATCPTSSGSIALGAGKDSPWVAILVDGGYIPADVEGYVPRIFNCPSGGYQHGDKDYGSCYVDYGYIGGGFGLCDENITVVSYGPKKISDFNSSSAVLMFDCVRTWDDEYPYPSTYVNHWKSGIPTGGNILYLDGHVKWKVHKDMEIKHHYSSRSYFEW